MFRNRDLFVHDGTKLRRIRISAPLQAVFFVALLGLVAWASYATTQLITRPMDHARSSGAATDVRARMIEQRQALIEQALAGGKIDPELLAAATSGRIASDGPLARVEQQQFAAGGARRQGIGRALPGDECRAEAARDQTDGSGLAAKKASAVRSKASAIRPSRALFDSWKKLDELQDDVIAIPVRQAG